MTEKEVKGMWIADCFRISGQVVEDIKEVKALLSFRSVKMVEANRNRAIAAIDSAIESLKELRLLISAV